VVSLWRVAWVSAIIDRQLNQLPLNISGKLATARAKPYTAFMLRTLAITNYRSRLSLTIPLGRLNVITGANGSGKSNLYRALRLLALAG